MKRKLNKSEFYDLLYLAGKEVGEKPYLRKGQALFNTYYKLWPAWADEIRGTKCDPFSNDALIDKFYKKIYG